MSMPEQQFTPGDTVIQGNLLLLENFKTYETGLEEAQRLVYGDRNDSYGHPATDFERTAKMWSAILGIEVTALQASLCMVALKLSRECNKHKRDNLVDAAGYAEVALRIARKNNGEEPN